MLKRHWKTLRNDPRIGHVRNPRSVPPRVQILAHGISIGPGVSGTAVSEHSVRWDEEVATSNHQRDIEQRRLEFFDKLNRPLKPISNCVWLNNHLVRVQAAGGEIVLKKTEEYYLSDWYIDKPLYNTISRVKGSKLVPYTPE